MNQEALPFADIDHVGAVITYAHTQKASDLHFEPSEKTYHIRMRQDGLLSSIFMGGPHHASRINTQLKVMAELDIAEQRVPQDGRITFAVNSGHHLNIRVSTCPTAYGEKIVLRLLDPKAHIRTFVELGFEDAQRELFTHAIEQPNGLVLVTGPAGSGKTTTLYSALNSLNKNTRNIATIEDPVEITLPGVNQVPVFAKLKLTFARILRSLIRQDPDVNPLFPAIRSAPTAVSRASRRKQIPSNSIELKLDGDYACLY